MTVSSIKKYSLLGLVLIAASAVTAAILPSKANVKTDSQGKLVPSTGGAGDQLSCVATANPTGCNVSATTDTSADQGDPNTSTDAQGSTSLGANNTTF